MAKAGVTKAKSPKGKPKFDIHGNAGNPHGAGSGKPNTPAGKMSPRKSK